MSRSSGVPLYLQLIDVLTHDIENHVYKAGDQLPSERELCDLYQLSRITVRQALQELEREGTITKKHGKGTFVAEKPIQQNLVNLYSFTDEMKRLGKIPKTKVLDFEVIRLNSRLAKKLKMDAGIEVVRVTRLRLADDRPLMYETTYLPRTIFPYLTREQFEQRSMYTIFRQDYDVYVTKVVEKFTATKMQKNEAAQLTEATGTPAILIKRYGYDHERLVEYTSSIVSSGKFYYRVEITN
ncbi:GntR family transcriptional regulator [Sporolactobacillus terrae]|uniref:GntR family transcriptional regulator n=1 Tax=Sporolactobacillus terrae TaxID=269673 RepID=A0ABX5QBM1_9BACL|nr:GntR family transcriptional regulator [Sporolactobacillus terrae]QAA26921.1 GntR family transcriptional regulator [Sporolactobacillus terrae]UAK17823.1 GntR family transcriptional regulator [Sporolactobacillus terrae]